MRSIRVCFSRLPKLAAHAIRLADNSWSSWYSDAHRASPVADLKSIRLFGEQSPSAAQRHLVAPIHTFDHGPPPLAPWQCACLVVRIVSRTLGMKWLHASRARRHSTDHQARAEAEHDS